MRPCPINIQTRAVLAKIGEDEALDLSSDRMVVTGVSMEMSVDGPASDHRTYYNRQGEYIKWRKGAVLTITQEVYADVRWHEVFFHGCLVDVEKTTRGTRVSPRIDTTRTPITIEVHEVGGNVMRFPSCVGNFSLKGDPADRIFIEWEFRGAYEVPEDTNVDWESQQWFTDIPNPLIYKRSSIQFQVGDNELVDTVTCPSFSFETGFDFVDVPMRGSPTAQPKQTVVYEGMGELSLSGVLGAKESQEKVWEAALQYGRNYYMKSVLAKFGEGFDFYVMMDGYRLKDATEEFIEDRFRGGGYKFVSTDWEIWWAGIVLPYTPMEFKVGDAGFVAIRLTDSSEGLIDWGDGNTTLISGDGVYNHSYTEALPSNVTAKVWVSAYEARFATNSNITEIVAFGDIDKHVLPLQSLEVVPSVHKLPKDASEMFKGASSFIFNEDNWSGWDFSEVENLTSFAEGTAGIVFLLDVAPNVTTVRFFARGVNEVAVGSLEDNVITDYTGMLQGAGVLIAQLNTGSGIHFNSMFQGATFISTQVYDDLRSFDMQDALDISDMFRDSQHPYAAAGGFLSTWDTSNIRNMARAFQNITTGPQWGPMGASGWDVSNVINMDQLFYQNTMFNEDLSSWCVEQIPQRPNLFDDGATSYTLPRPRWGAQCGDASTDMTVVVKDEYDEDDRTLHVILYMSEEGVIDWGDGDSESWPVGGGGGGDWDGHVYLTHQYPEGSGIYNLKITADSYLEGIQVGSVGTPSIFDSSFTKDDILPTKLVTKAGYLLDGVRYGLHSTELFNLHLDYEAPQNCDYMLSYTGDIYQDLSSWDMSSCKSMDWMFYDSYADPEAMYWDTSSIESMEGSFSNTHRFNTDITEIDVSSVTNMDELFHNAEVFNQDLSRWCVIGVPDEPVLFDEGADEWVLPRPEWGTCGGGFHPMELNPLIWLDPTDQSTLFRDAEGTQPVEAAGDPVGLIVNKGTLGGDADLIAPDSASRPVWLGDMLRWDGSQRMGTSGWAPDWGFTLAAYSISAGIEGSGYFVGVGANSPNTWAYGGNRSGWAGIGNNAAISDGSEYDGVNNNLTPELLAYPKTTNASGGWTDGVRAWHMTATEYKDSSNMPAHGWTGRGPVNKPSQGIRFGTVRWTSLWHEGMSGSFFLFDRELTQQEITQLLRWLEAQHD